MTRRERIALTLGGLALGAAFLAGPRLLYLWLNLWS